jgi:hypothetical protein
MSPRKPTAKSIRAAVEKHTPKAAPAPKKAPSIVIQDACAAKGCVNPPAKGGFCEEHLVQAQLAQLIQETSLPAKAHAAIKATAEKVAVKVRPDLAKVSKAEVVAAKEAVQKLAKAPRKDPKKAPPKLDHAARKAAAIHETKAVMATLLKAGLDRGAHRRGHGLHPRLPEAVDEGGLGLQGNAGAEGPPRQVGPPPL